MERVEASKIRKMWQRQEINEIMSSAFGEEYCKRSCGVRENVIGIQKIESSD